MIRRDSHSGERTGAWYETGYGSYCFGDRRTCRHNNSSISNRLARSDRRQLEHRRELARRRCPRRSRRRRRAWIGRRVPRFRYQQLYPRRDLDHQSRRDPLAWEHLPYNQRRSLQRRHCGHQHQRISLQQPSRVQLRRDDQRQRTHHPQRRSRRRRRTDHRQRSVHSDSQLRSHHPRRGTHLRKHDQRGGHQRRQHRGTT